MGYTYKLYLKTRMKVLATILVFCVISASLTHEMTENNVTEGLKGALKNVDLNNFDVSGLLNMLAGFFKDLSQVDAKEASADDLMKLLAKFMTGLSQVSSKVEGNNDIMATLAKYIALLSKKDTAEELNCSSIIDGVKKLFEARIAISGIAGIHDGSAMGGAMFLKGLDYAKNFLKDHC